MRIILLVVLEIAAAFAIPRAYYEARMALGFPLPVFQRDRVAKAAPLAVVVSGKPAPATEAVQIFAVTELPSEGALSKQRAFREPRGPVEAVPSPSEDDDYLPPWMRDGKRLANQAGAIRVAVAAQAPEPARKVRASKRRGERRATRRSRGSRSFFLGF
jgi:hypothetical protein